MRMLVTGATRGVGLHLTERALDAGHEVEAVYRTETEELSSLARRHPRLSMVRADLTDPGAEQTLSRWRHDEPLDVIVNNAGLYSPERGAFQPNGQQLAEVTPARALELFSLNTVAPMLVVRACAHRLGSHSPVGKIVNVTSLIGTLGAARHGGQYLYGPTKAALNWITVAMAQDLAPLVVVGVSPGWVRTRTGGHDAPRDGRQAGADLMRVIEQVGPSDSGALLDEEGRPLE